MKRLRLARLALLLAAALARPGAVTAQDEEPRTSSQLRVFAAAVLEVERIHDDADVQLARPENKKVERQAEIRAGAKAEIARAIEAHGLTRARYDRFAYLVTTDPAWRKVFERRLEEARAAPPARPSQ